MPLAILLEHKTKDDKWELITPFIKVDNEFHIHPEFIIGHTELIEEIRDYTNKYPKKIYQNLSLETVFIMNKHRGIFIKPEHITLNFDDIFYCEKTYKKKIDFEENLDQWQRTSIQLTGDVNWFIKNPYIDYSLINTLENNSKITKEVYKWESEYSHFTILKMFLMNFIKSHRLHFYNLDFNYRMILFSHR